MGMVQAWYVHTILASKALLRSLLPNQDEETPFRPRSPYGVAKAAAYWQVANYREAYGLFACTGILANHESPLRPNRFVTQKIIQAVKSIAAGSQKKLLLGNLDIWRDWGWAAEYVKAMHAMLSRAKPADYLIASGQTHSLKQFVDAAFAIANLVAEDWVEISGELLRPTDLHYSAMDPSRFYRDSGWAARYDLADIVEKMYRDILF